MDLKRIKDLREDSDLSQAQIAKIIDLKRSTYTHYEKGTRMIPFEVLIKLANYYNISIDYIFELTDSKRSHEKNKNITNFNSIRIKELRKYNNLTQKILADKINLKQPTYAYYEIGNRTIPIETLIDLAKYYNTSLDYLIGITDNNKAYPPKKKIINNQ